MSLLAFLTCVFLFQSQSAEAVKCLQCTDMPHPFDCNLVAECSSEELCFVEQFLTSSGILLYNSGCMSKQRCSIPKRGLGWNVSKRQNEPVSNKDLGLCIECCQGEYCNTQGCGEQAKPRLSRGPKCFSCSAQTSPGKCRDTIDCDNQEVCALYKNHRYDTEMTSMCMGRLQCQALVQYQAAHLTQANPANMVGKRNVANIKTCPRCCEDDFCNDECQHNVTYTVTTTATVPPPTQLTTAHHGGLTTMKITSGHLTTVKTNSHGNTSAHYGGHNTTNTMSGNHGNHTTNSTSSHSGNHGHHNTTIPPSHHGNHVTNTTSAHLGHHSTTVKTHNHHQNTTTPPPHVTKSTPAHHIHVTNATSAHQNHVTNATSAHHETTTKLHTTAQHVTTTKLHTTAQHVTTTKLHTTAQHVTTTKLQTTTTPHLVTTPDPSIKCKTDGYVYAQASRLCLRFVMDKKNWTDAQHTCQHYNGRLVVMTSDPKTNAVNDYLTQQTKHHGIKFWVGATEVSHVHAFTWTNGKVVVIDDYDKYDLTQTNCLLTAVPKPAKVYDPCPTKNAFICENSDFIRA